MVLAFISPIQTLRLREERCMFHAFSKTNLKMILHADGENIFQQKIKKNGDKFKFDSNYPGTAPPGTVEENFPLKEVLELKIDNLNVQEFSREQHCGVIRGADESILDWLQSKGKIKPRLNEDSKDDLVEKNQTLLEDEFDFEDGEDSLGNFFGQPNSNLSDFV